MNLYTKYAQDFSNTRNAPWKGWERLALHLKSLGPLRVLDLGCGNLRFYGWLAGMGIEVEKYLGIDNSSEMLQIAKERYPEQKNITLQNFDLNKSDHFTQSQDFNLVVAFGLMHHLETFESRQNVYNIATRHLVHGGIFCTTFWQFKNLKRYKDKITKYSSSTDPNDFIMSFGSDGAERFCHFADLEEIKRLENPALSLLETFSADGRENNENIYRIYTKKNQ